ncbi:MAG: metalloregulator ArsR/SmtB family transcription factor [Desulfarculaceae bacterium]|nr:metalloregulator ArsR/SmtB family transcription factor [Desulfarculaceae bacterium]MCF8072474.1 metalloregulator ArsR/SmtB family transcription factor [Desulfarculaceae bacterium]MCF8102935.1 metalloregulator ArsR/SmtB family transcription factor [Desulfarculaceae bacterium]MCF8117462.1 metalloregulator ArsR/SmtB family transcription factor [Desulfarculaceae bacterium]
MDEAFLSEAAEMLKVMGHPLRIRIAHCLEPGELNVGDISQAIGATQSATSQHLKAMRMRGLLDARRDGACMYYRIARPEVYKIIQCVRESAARAQDGNQVVGGH